MAPALQEKSDVLALVGSSLLFGLLVQSFKRLLALMESANKVPFCFAGSKPLTYCGLSLFPA